MDKNELRQNKDRSCQPCRKENIYQQYEFNKINLRLNTERLLEGLSWELSEFQSLGLSSWLFNSQEKYEVVNGGWRLDEQSASESHDYGEHAINWYGKVLRVDWYMRDPMQISIY